MRTADPVHWETPVLFYNYEIANGDGGRGAVCDAAASVSGAVSGAGSADEEWGRVTVVCDFSVSRSGSYTP